MIARLVVKKFSYGFILNNKTIDLFASNMNMFKDKKFIYNYFKDDSAYTIELFYEWNSTANSLMNDPELRDHIFKNYESFWNTTGLVYLDTLFINKYPRKKDAMIRKYKAIANDCKGRFGPYRNIEVAAKFAEEIKNDELANLIIKNGMDNKCIKRETLKDMHNIKSENRLAEFYLRFDEDDELN